MVFLDGKALGQRIRRATCSWTARAFLAGGHLSSVAAAARLMRG
jgi:hypothetical protein